MERVLDGISVFIFAIMSLVGAYGVEEPLGDSVASQAGEVRAVIDGDTIIVEIDGKEEFVRYIGIDAPEEARDGVLEECFAEEATRENTDLVLERTVWLERDEENRDQYNRLLRYVYVGDVFVNAELVRAGFAHVLTIPPNTRFASVLKNTAQIAEKESRGLWTECP